MRDDDLSRDELTAVIESLRAEIDSLTEAMRLRGIIEQAKGVLMARESIGSDAAFQRLREMSQEANARLVDVAAALIGVTLPPDDGLDVDDSVLPERLRPSSATSPRWLEIREDARVRRGVAGAVFDVLAENATNGDEAAQLTREFLAPLGVTAVNLWRLRGDASLEQVGQVGYPVDLASAWRRVPLSLELPLTTAARDGEPVFLRSAKELAEEFPLTQGAHVSGNEALAVIPIQQDERPVGVVGMSWQEPREFAPDERARVARSVTRVGRVLLRERTFGELDFDYFVQVLGLLDDPWIALRATDPGVAGLVVDAVSDDVKDQPPLTGQRLLAVFPCLVDDRHLMGELHRLLATGGRFTRAPHPRALTTTPWDRDRAVLRGVRLGSRVVLAWRGQP